MVRKQDFKKVTPYIWELPKGTDPRMRVPARVYASERLFDQAFRDRSIEQLVNVAMLPGIVRYAMAMPDVHQGYGFPIGGVAAFDYEQGVISPGGVGYDINCGVRMLASNLAYEEVEPYLGDLANVLYHKCPSGVGGKGVIQLTWSQLDAVLEEGASWACRAGYGSPEDLLRTEEGGRLPQALASAVPERAKERGRPQLGSLGAGNHFLEIDVVDEIYDAGVATVFGLQLNRIVVQIHCGSRGLGHEVCAQYLRRLQGAPQRYGITVPDRELVAAPVDSVEGQDYLAAMAAAANYAFANRQVLAHAVRLGFEEVLAGKVSDWALRQVYDVAHNIAKVENHVVEGRERRLVVHRKGATRAFPPGHRALPSIYQATGHPVLVPGSMGTASYVLAGLEENLGLTFGSTCHGAGRTMSRRAAVRSVRGEAVQGMLRKQGISVWAHSMRGLAEEAPMAYKDVSLVVDAVAGAGIARKVARVRPIVVIKG